MRRLGGGLGETEQQFTIDSEQSDTLQTESKEKSLNISIYSANTIEKLYFISIYFAENQKRRIFKKTLLSTVH